MLLELQGGVARIDYMSMGANTEENGRDGERQTEREREDRERMRMGPNSLVCSWIALLQA